MSRTRIVGGSITKITGKSHNMYSTNGNINFIAGNKITEVGEEEGVEITNKPEFPDKLGTNGFTYKWTTDKEGKNEITKAELYDVVYFHIEFDKSKKREIKIELYHKAIDLRIHKILELTESKLIIKLDFISYLDQDFRKYDEKEIINIWEKIKDETLLLFWKITVDNHSLNLDDKILKVFADDYCMAILGNRYRYTCYAGWIDKTHAFGITDTYTYVGAKSLWLQIRNENRISNSRKGFKVTTKQISNVKGIDLSKSLDCFVRHNLTNHEKKQVAVSILKEISMTFEEFQGNAKYLEVLRIGNNHSSFEPSDLISNLVGLYFVFYLDEKNILDEYSNIKKDNDYRKQEENCFLERAKPLSTKESLRIYRKNPGTFTEEKHKNKKFTPKYYENEFCTSEEECLKHFKQYFDIYKDIEKSDNTYRDWNEVLDSYYGGV